MLVSTYSSTHKPYVKTMLVILKLHLFKSYLTGSKDFKVQLIAFNINLNEYILFDCN